jgi:hypothetical protein
VDTPSIRHYGTLSRRCSIIHSISGRIQGTLPPHLCQAFHDRLHLSLDSVTLYVVLVTNRLLLRCSVSGSFRERKRSDSGSAHRAGVRAAELPVEGFSLLSHSASLRRSRLYADGFCRNKAFC